MNFAADPASEPLARVDENLPPARRVVLGVTGASGAIYGSRMLRHLRRAGAETHLIVSRTGIQVSAHEGHGFPRHLDRGADGLPGSVVRHAEEDLFAAPASGSFRHCGMVIAPCSTGTVGRLASGVSDTLLLRAADVCLKERRPLVVVVRETPLGRVHLRNLLALDEAGALILPASPSFYNGPETIEDLVDTVLARALDHLGFDLDISPRWKEA